MSEHETTKPRVSVQQPGNDRKEDMGSVRKSVLFLCAVGIAYFLFLIISGEMGKFIDALAGIDLGWVFTGFLCWGVYFAMGVLAYAIAVFGDKRSPLGIADLMSVEATGIFFSHLTPNGAGGAPAQIVRLMRSGLSAGAAGALQYTRFIIYEAGEGIFAALMLIPRMGYFYETYGDVSIVGLLLFGYKVVEVGALLLVCLFPNIVKRVGNWLLRLLKRHGWLKRYDHWDRLINEEVQEFSNGFKTGASNWRLMLLTLAVTLLQLACQYSLPWITLQAFGRPADFLTCMACGSMIELLTSAIPLPGGTGGAEGGFAFLFASMFGDALSAGYVVWRMLQYVLPVLASIPLMGLRTTSGLSLNARIRRFKSRFDRPGR